MKLINYHKLSLVLTALAVSGVATSQPAIAASFTSYSITDLGTFGGNSNSANAINDLGQLNSPPVETRGILS